MKTLVMVSLNTYRYQLTIGELPTDFLKICTVEVQLADGKLDEKAKREAVREYWKKAGGTGGHKIAVKTHPNLFRISLV
jgi:hypothetical protein